MNAQSKTCIVIRHIHFEDLGCFEQPLRDSGYSISYLEAPLDELDNAYNSDLLVILGGPCGVDDANHYPYLRQEIEIAKHRLVNNLPLLGVCLGAQIIAGAAGAKVYLGDNGKEIGWAPLSFTEAGLDSPLSPLNEGGSPMFHWHGDTFELPENATLIASSARYKNQIFSIGNAVLGFQCHPELDSTKIEHWLIGHACELASTSHIDLEQLRTETQVYGAQLRQNATRALNNWLAGLR